MPKGDLKSLHCACPNLNMWKFIVRDISFESIFLPCMRVEPGAEKEGDDVRAREQVVVLMVLEASRS